MSFGASHDPHGPLIPSPHLPRGTRQRFARAAAMVDTSPFAGPPGGMSREPKKLRDQVRRGGGRGT